MFVSALPLLAILGALAFAQTHDGQTIAANVVALTGDAPGATKAYRFNTLLKLAKDTNLVDALGTPNITLFAPTDAAFMSLTNPPSDVALVRDILTYHVTPGAFPADKLAPMQIVPTLLNRQGSPYVQFSDPKTAQPLNIVKGADGVTVSWGLGKAKVTDSIPSTNGVIHVVDAVLKPPKKVSETAVAAKLTQLVGALTKAQLVAAVDGAKSITVFAPTDAAFDAIKDTVAKLTDAQLQEVLKYHVVTAVAYSTDLPANLDAPTLVDGAKVNVKKSADGVMVNDAKVVTADVFVNNGVVHVIDKVLIPPSLRSPSSGSGTSAGGASTTTAGGAPRSTSGTGSATGGALANAASLPVAGLIAGAVALLA